MDSANKIPIKIRIQKPVRKINLRFDMFFSLKETTAFIMPANMKGKLRIISIKYLLTE